jgi:hydrogenase-4 component B
MIPLNTITVMLVITGALLTLIITLVTRNRTVVYGETWDCGMPVTPRTEITATSFSRSIVVIFNRILRATKQTSVEYHDAASHYFVSSHSLEVEHDDVYREKLYLPIQTAVEYIAMRAKRVQTGNVNLYIFYAFATVIILLLYISFT